LIEVKKALSLPLPVWGEHLVRARSLISRLLRRKLGPLPDSLQAQVKALSLEQLEALGEALFDFAEASDLAAWLAQQ
jgi:hypothetical protein